MFIYSFKRFLLALLVLIVISMFTFWMSISSPGDPISILSGRNSELTNSVASLKSSQELRRSLGLDLPLFYLSIQNAVLPDTLNRISDSRERQTLHRICFNHGHWEHVSKYSKSLSAIEVACAEMRDDSVGSIKKMRNVLNELKYVSDDAEMPESLDRLEASASGFPSLRIPMMDLRHSADVLLKDTRGFERFVPSIVWNGFNNQYHKWLVQFTHGDLGFSYFDRKPVSRVLFPAFGRTLLLSLMAFILVFTIGVPLGVFSSMNRYKMKHKFVNAGLIFLHSVPVFWMSTLVIVLFCGGSFLSIFPAYGLGDVFDDDPFLYKLVTYSQHLVLPVFCLTYGSLAYISRQTESSMMNELNREYVVTATAKGLSRKSVIWKHAFKNALFPLISIASSMLPVLLSGSFIVEFIFSIPGMGKITFDAIQTRDYPIVFSSVMLVSVATVVVNFFSDVVFAVSDPRVSFSSRSAPNE